MTRTANFSSSEIWKLMTKDRKGTGFGAPALTYIDEKRIERRLNRPLKTESNAKETNWGTFIERRVFDMLSIVYDLKSDVRYKHPTIDNWTGSPDLITETAVCDIKCPYTLKSFCTMVDSLNANTFKDDKPEYYWQLVSNAILTDKNYAEIIIYVPYQQELSEIREAANLYDGDQNKVAFLNWATDDELPYLIEGGFYKNINTFTFKVPDEDKKELTAAVERANILLNETT